MKKTLSIFLVLIILLFAINKTPAVTDEIPVYFDGNRIIFDVNPVIMNGRTMVPMRAVFELFGASVDYNSQTKQITAVKGSLKIILNLGITYATVSKNGVLTEYTLDATPIAIEGRTVVPLRFIGEALGTTVNWDGTTRIITIVSGYSSQGGSGLDIILTATEIAKLMEPRSVILECYDPENNLISSGSGFFINSNGYIATNYHVYEGSFKIIATLSNGGRYKIEKVIHVDKGRDLIVVGINKTGTPYVTLGDSSKIETGNKIYTFGSPLGFSNTLSEGIVSNKSIIYDGYYFLQISAPVSPGSSGGCVIDEKGNVIGVVQGTMIYGQNMNHSIPINDLKSLLAQNPLIIKRINYSSGYYYGYTLDNIRHFKGTSYWDNEDIYEGDYDMGERAGYGKYTWGPGEWYGDVYEGDFYEDDMHGTGTYSWSNGDEYYGDFVKGKATGYGIYTWANGDWYIGDFLNWKFHGYGTIYFTNGTEKSGYWDMGIYVGNNP